MHVLTAVPMFLWPENRLLCLNATSPVKPFWTVAMETESTLSMLCVCLYYIAATLYMNVNYAIL